MPGLRGWVYSQPYDGGRGGDVHYLSVCNSGLLARMCLADVAGHGEAVGAISQMLHTQLRRHLDYEDHRVLMARLNRQLMDDEIGAFATAATVTYYPPARRLSVSYAGHPPVWYYRREDRRWLTVQSDAATSADQLVNLPLAIDRRTEFTWKNFRVQWGDRLVMLTDGILEAPNGASEFFGDRRFGALLHEHAESSPQELVQHVAKQIGAWTGGQKHDDITLLMVEFEPGPPGPAVWTALKNRLLRPMGLVRPQRT